MTDQGGDQHAYQPTHKRDVAVAFATKALQGRRIYEIAQGIEKAQEEGRLTVPTPSSPEAILDLLLSMEKSGFTSYQAQYLARERVIIEQLSTPAKSTHPWRNWLSAFGLTR